MLRLAFAADGTGAPVGVALRQAERDGPVAVEAQGDAAPDALLTQVARILSLDGDGDAWAAVGEREPLIGGLQARFGGLRPVLFASPYEAACWAVISARLGREEAMRLRDAIAGAHGQAFKLAGEVRRAWPAPATLLAALEAERVIGLPGEKLRRLHGVATAAAAGALDASRLHALGPERAADALGELRGFGAFYRELVVVGGVGFTDAPSAQDARARRAAAQLHGLGDLDAERFAALAEAWRPFRAWATVLLRASADRDGL